MLRHQLPAYSPITWGGIGAGVGALLRGDPDGSLRRRVSDLLRSRYGARAVVLTDSGTSALRLAIAGAIRGRERQPVALPGYCCYDVATAAEGAAARVALYDLDVETLGPDLPSLDAVMALAPPAAVVIAHLYGLPVNVSAVQGRIGDALLIEDAAQGAGGSLGGKPLGSFGSVSVLSFGRGKGMTGGGGGALLAHDDRGMAIAAWAAALLDSRRAPGGLKQVTRLVAQRLLGRPALYGLPASVPFLRLGETVYRPPHAPAVAAVASLAALEQMFPDSDREAAVRRKNADWWLGAMKSGGATVFAVAPGGQAGYLRFPVRVRPDISNAEVRTLRARGVMRGYPTTLARLPSLGAALVHHAACTASERLAKAVLTLPTHSHLRAADRRAIGGFLRGA